MKKRCGKNSSAKDAPDCLRHIPMRNIGETPSRIGRQIESSRHVQMNRSASSRPDSFAPRR
jgi:hypothetical protein